jgi:hypothetical protein
MDNCANQMREETLGLPELAEYKDYCVKMGQFFSESQ